MANDALKTVEKKTQRYWFEDGIWEIAFGMIHLVLCGFFLLTGQRKWEGPMALVLLLLQMGVILGIFWLVNRLVRWMKERITYPRTGFVAYRRQDRGTRLRRGLRSGLIGAATAAAIGLTAALQNAAHILPLVVALGMALGLGLIGYRFGLLRLYALAVLTIAIGTALAMLPLDENQVIVYFFGGFGLLMMLSGILTLAVYLRSTRPPGETVDYLAPDEVPEISSEHGENA